MRTLIITGIVLSLCTTNAPAKPWKDANPGKTTREQIVNLFGAPTQEFSKGGKLSNGLNYQGKQAIEGAEQANFFFDKNDILFRIDIFPAREITREQVIQVFGKNYQERKTPKGHVFYDYSRDGLIAFFDQEKDRVITFTFLTEKTSATGTNSSKTSTPKNP